MNQRITTAAPAPRAPAPSPAPLPPREVELHIEELVLHGLPHAPAPHIADALRARLQTLLAQNQPALWPRTDVELEYIRAPAVHLAPGAPAAAIGAHLANTLHHATATALNTREGPR